MPSKSAAQQRKNWKATIDGRIRQVAVLQLALRDVAHWKSKAENYELDLTEANRHIVSLRLENLQLNAKLDQLAADNEKLHRKQEIVRLVVARPSPRAQADHYVSKFAVEKASK